MIEIRPQFLVDMIDVLVVAFLFYRLFAMIKGTRAAQMFVGLVFIVIASIVAQWFRLNALNWIINSLKTVWVILFVIMFVLGIPVGPGYQVPFAEAVKKATGLPVMAVGLITEPQQAEDIVASGKADLVALARALLYDPRWPWHAAAELGGTVSAPPQYWRSQPSTQKALFGDTTFGGR